MLWSIITKRGGHKQINAQVKKYLYNWILQHPHIFQSPISNYCIKVSIDGPSKPQLVPKLLPQVSTRELHNSMVSPPEEFVIKEAIDVDNNVIINDSTLQSILPPQIKKISAHYKVM